MSCCGCLENPVRITNLFRHEELSLKYTDLTDITIITNLFICDTCIIKLESSFEFKRKCIDNYDELVGLKHSEPRLKQEENIEVEETDEVYEILEEEIQEEYLQDDPLSRVEFSDYIEEDPHTSTSPSDQKQEYFYAESSEQQQETGKSSLRSDRSSKIEKSSPKTREKSLNRNKEQKDSETIKIVRGRKSYSSGQKLEVIKFAEVTGNRQASRVFSIDESCIRKWRQQKEMLTQIHQERGTKRKPNLHWAELDKQLKAWVLSMMEEGVTLKPREIKAQSIILARELNIDNFKGTSSYVFKFMERYHIPGRRKASQK